MQVSPLERKSGSSELGYPYAKIRFIFTLLLVQSPRISEHDFNPDRSGRCHTKNMPMTRKRTLLLISAALIVAGAVVLVRGFFGDGRTNAQSDSGGPRQTAAPVGDFDVARRQAIDATLSRLLANTDLSIGDTTIPQTAAEADIFHVSLETQAGRPGGDTPDTTSLRILSHRKKAASEIRLARSFDLSPSQVVIFAVDAQKRVVWWEIKPDPRVVRAETSDANGNLEGSTFRRPAADMLISVPAGRGVEAVHLFAPNWNGNSYSLEPQGSFAAGKN